MWRDKESDKDYLNFGYIVDLIVEIAMNRNLTPSTIGLYGDWGSGKSTLMQLAKSKIEELSKKITKEEDAPKTLCIEFNGWLFEGYEETKTSLCGSILDTLADEKRFGPEVTDYAKGLLDKIDFQKLLGKGIRFGVDYLLTGGIGALTDLTLSSILNSIKMQASEIDANQIEEMLGKFKKDEKTRTEINQFRDEFKELLKKSKVKNVVVFIDELDRCDPDTILDVFEAMRLFLFVDRMSFVIGADERLIQYAIKSKYKEVPGNNLDIGKEYLEKVIQYPINIPQLNHAEVNQYLDCLLLEQKLKEDEFSKFLEIIHSMEPDKELTMELLEEKADSIAEKCKTDMALAKQISSVLAPSINGNPRQCKRFLNTLFMRLKLADARGVTLDKNILAKLLLAEYFKSDFFDALVKEDNRDAFKSFEAGERLTNNNPFSTWEDDAWVKTWRNNGTNIGGEKLEKYIYFANVKNRYGHSKLYMLSPSARKCYEWLANRTDFGRSQGLKMVKDLSSGEKSIIASELFGIIENSSEMNVEVLRSFTDYCIEADTKGFALEKLLELPVDKYTFESYGQLTSFLRQLTEDEKNRFNNYLSSNQTLVKTIERTKQATDAIKSIKK